MFNNFFLHCHNLREKQPTLMTKLFAMVRILASSVLDRSNIAGKVDSDI